MNKELFISTRGKTHAVALLEGGVLVEFNKENEDDISIVGNIYKGKVEQVLKGMQAAFVNIGRKKNGYLFMDDSIIDGQDLTTAQEYFINKTITAQPGDSVMVQVSKTEIALKGARLTPNISLAGRFLVYMPNVNYIGVSRKITDEEIRHNLTSLVEKNKGENGGFIIRTACQTASEQDLIHDIQVLENRWLKILENYETAEQTMAVYQDGGILYRAVRDLVGRDVNSIVVDDYGTLAKVKEYMAELGYDDSIVQMFDKKNVDLFNFYGITGEVMRVLDNNVQLDNGAYIVIEKTEALTVIDVNTGKYVGSTNLEDTVFETNILAAKAIAAQLRLRNIGGIIVVDFIDMSNEIHKELVMQTLADAVKKDRVRTAVVDMTELGLVEITRKKSREEVRKTYSKPCVHCGGKGYLMTNEALRIIMRKRLFEVFENNEVTGVVIGLSPENAKEMFDSRAFSFEIAVYWEDKRIYVVPNPMLTSDAFNIQEFKTGVIDVPLNAQLMY